ncbi:hypothetical protein L873DRAFT_1667800 [Choiromyces venosus 120613-1]|uniref:Tetratricopeptide repeat domain-containing protein n=1 Tax=Choiromyces venosus 120613-1 TaxID=1336337 RepID=A0A3N4K0Z1_9PEZI|nr:hypothetical protein L873DRAFT_1667800 [Choiromyces venosus 120613-1]
MVFKPFTTLARQSISKHLVNGYAQSVVAATQSSYASSSVQLSRLGQQNVPARLHTTFGSANSGRATPGKDGQGGDSLGAYYAAQSQAVDEKEEKENRKYLFSRKILWSKAQHQQQQKALLENPSSLESGVPRSRSSSLVQAEALLPSKDVVKGEEEAVFVESAAEELEVSSSEKVAPVEAAEAEFVPSPTTSEETLVPASPEVPSITTQYNDQLRDLRTAGKFEEISALFEHMIQEGVQPSTTTYNHVLVALIHTGAGGIARVLSVYQDMLRNKVLPSTVTYSILIDYLAANSKSSLQFARRIEDDTLRFGFVVPSRGRELNEVNSQKSLDMALDIFYASTEVRVERTFSEPVYSILIEACAEHGREEDMLKVYTHMEMHGVLPSFDTTLSLIKGFGKAGNISSAVETYNYCALDASKKPGNVHERYMVYKALILAYMEAGEPAGAVSFLEKIVGTSKDAHRSQWLAEAIIKGFLQQGDLESAKQWIMSRMAGTSEYLGLSRVLIGVADLGDYGLANQLYSEFMAYVRLHGINDPSTSISQMAFLNLCVKEGKIESARAVWNDLSERILSNGPDVEAAVVYSMMLFDNRLTNEALVVLKQFGEFFMEKPFGVPLALRTEYLQEAFENLIDKLATKNLLTHGVALDISGFSMRHCGRMGTQASRIVLGLFGEERILGLTLPQLDLLLQIQAGVLQQPGEMVAEDMHKFEQMLTIALNAGVPLSKVMKVSVDGVIAARGINGDLLAKWTAFAEAQKVWENMPMAPLTEDMVSSPTLVGSEGEAAVAEDNYDPYWAKTDVKVSQAIDNALEGAKAARVRLMDARRMYQQTRKAGRLVRMTTLARMVGAAARAGQPEFMEEIYLNARMDAPLLMEFRSVRYVWCILLDSMIAGQLSLGNRQQATVYHEEMLKMGASPSANTYGLYIVSLKGSNQTYDEASEALKIFERAKAENVLPSSFLYNALIGKLAKARRVDDCLFYFAEMRALGIKPTSVTYGTMINALTRVGDEHFAEELFQEMEAMPNYKPRPAPYNSLMQFFVNTKRDRSKVMSYFNRMTSLSIEATSHTYKLLIEAYATLDPPDMPAAEDVLNLIRAKNQPVESSHHAALIHAKGCVQQDVEAAISHFKSLLLQAGKPQLDNTIYQALFESLVANHRIHDTTIWLADMERRGVRMTPYIANTLIHGWALEKDIKKAEEVYDSLSKDENARLKREPSTYEAMTRAYLAVEDRTGAMRVVDEMSGRGYPSAVMVRVVDLVRGRGD